MKKIILAIACLALTACASTSTKSPSPDTTNTTQRPANASDYATQLQAPEETKKLILVDKKVFDDPLGGVMLRYVDKRIKSDWITSYVYPIARIGWEDINSVLTDEMNAVLAEVDDIVKSGKYLSRGEATLTDFIFTDEGTEYSGKKAEFTFINNDGVKYDSNAYLFIAEDKYIKFRTSFHADYTPDWNGDGIVKALLPNIHVPPESGYMHHLREEHRKAIMQKVLDSLTQVQKEAK